MTFDLYTPAPLPPKPAATAPKILDMSWTRSEDGTMWTWPSRKFSAELWDYLTVPRLFAVGIYKDDRRRLVYDPSVATADQVNAVVEQLRAERRERRAVERKASRQKGLL